MATASRLPMSPGRRPPSPSKYQTPSATILSPAASNPLTDIPKGDNETFVTQRGGKIVNELSAPISQVVESSSLFETSRTLQSTLLLQKKKEMHQVQALLEKKRQEFAKRMEECREKQEELRAKQKQIRDRVLKFEKFLKENDAKRQRANIKALSERKTKEAKAIFRELEYGGLLKSLQQEQAKAEKMARLIKKHKMYEQYLQSVVDSLPADYLDINEPHINDVLMRHKTLVETNDDLIKTVQEFQDDIESEQTRLTSVIKDKNDLILVYNSSLSTGQKKLEKLKQEVALMDQRLRERDNSSKERMRIMGEAKLAINNLYIRISRKTTKSNDSDDLPGPSLTLPAGKSEGLQEMASSQHEDKNMTEKLHAIQDRLLDLQLVVHKVEQYKK